MNANIFQKLTFVFFVAILVAAVLLGANMLFQTLLGLIFGANS